MELNPQKYATHSGYVTSDSQLISAAKMDYFAEGT